MYASKRSRNNDIELGESAIKKNKCDSRMNGVYNEILIDKNMIQSVYYCPGNPVSLLRSSNKNIRIVKIVNCPSFASGCDYICRQEFFDFFDNFPKSFVILIKIERDGPMTSSLFPDVTSKYGWHKRPLIICFENPSGHQIHYKNQGSGIFEHVNYPVNNKRLAVVDFKTLMTNLKHELDGSYGGKFENLKIKSECIQSLMNQAGSYRDALLIRFLHLFDPSVKPEGHSLNGILWTGFFENSVHGYAAVYEREFQLSLHKGDNLLMLAVRDRNLHAVKCIIEGRVNLAAKNADCETAAQIADKLGYYEILNKIIMANASYPPNFNIKSIEYCPEDLKTVFQITEDLHKFIDAYDDTEVGLKIKGGEIIINEDLLKSAVNEILQMIRPREKPELHKMKYFYNINNQSALAHAVKSKKHFIFLIFISSGLYFGPREDVPTILKSLKENEKSLFKFISDKYANEKSENYRAKLIANSIIWHQNLELPSQMPIIEEVFKALDSYDELKPILQIVAEVDGFRIFFDFNSDSTQRIDFTQPDVSQGVIYFPDCRIYIAAKRLTEERKNEVLGALIHELYHMALRLTYDNDCKPYRANDTEIKAKYKHLVESYQQKKNEEGLINVALETSNKDQVIDELAVCVPHMLVHYKNDQNTLAQKKELFKELFDDFDKRIQEDIKNEIGKIKTKVFQSEISVFNYWTKVKRKQRIYQHISAITILAFLAFLYFSYFWYWNCLTFGTVCTWPTIPKWYKKQILNRKVPFQGGRMIFGELVNWNPQHPALNALSDNEIKHPSEIIIYNQNLSLPYAAYERKLTRPNNKYLANIYGGPCRYSYLLDEIWTFDEVRNKSADSRKIYIFNSEALAGTTSFLLNNLRRMRNSTSSVWSVYFNFKRFKKFHKYLNLENWTFQNITNILIDVHEPELSAAGIEIFKDKLNCGNVTLVLDHADTIYLKSEKAGGNFIENLIKNINYQAEIWIGTRPWYGKKINEILMGLVPNFRNHYKLLPLYCDDRDEFKKLVLKNSPSSVLAKFDEILKMADVYRNSKPHITDNIGLLTIAMEHALEVSKTTINLYNIFNDFNIRISNYSMHAVDPTLSLRNIKCTTNIERLVPNTFVLDELKKHYGHSIKVHVDFEKLKTEILNADQMLFSNKDETECLSYLVKLEVLSMENESEIIFTYLIQREFHVARYIIDNFWLRINDSNYTNDLFKNKLMLFFTIFCDRFINFPVVRRCITDYINDNPGKVTFDVNFKKVFKESYDEFMKHAGNINVAKSLLPIFGNDEDLRQILEQQ